MDSRTRDEYYERLFMQNPEWSRQYPNPGEATRWGPIARYLSAIACARPVGSGLRILDVGCGRGWLTYLANIYGRCDGIDPVEAPLALARTRYPGLLFTRGTLQEVCQSATFQPYDVVVASEVIEHVIDKDLFVAALCRSIVEDGHAVLTTPRLELKRWLPFEPDQPIEAWLSERDLRALFLRHGFLPVQHDRVVGVNTWSRHPRNRLSRIDAVSRWLEQIGLAWLKEGLEYITGIYQTWWFQKITFSSPKREEEQAKPPDYGFEDRGEISGLDLAGSRKPAAMTSTHYGVR